MEEKSANAGTGSERAASGCFICETALPMIERCLGTETVGHFRNSRIEFLKGVRSLIDERIACLSKETEHKGTHVTVE
jgi:hypothetical protein